MIIDAHVHLKHGDRAKTEYSADQIVETMDHVGIDRSIIFAMSTTTAQSIIMAKEAVHKYPKRLIPFVYALPSYETPVLSELEVALRDDEFKGIKIHAGECSLAEYIISPVFELAERYDVPCLIDCRGDVASIAKAAATFPRTKIIVAHLGLYLCTNESLIESFISLGERFSNIYFDISGVVLPWMIREAVQRLGSDRIIFGTDGPHKKPTTQQYALGELARLQSLGLPSDDMDAILHNTIARLIRLDESE